MSVTKLSTKDFNIENCSICRRKFTRAMMIQIIPDTYECIKCHNGGFVMKPPQNKKKINEE